MVEGGVAGYRVISQQIDQSTETEIEFHGRFNDKLYL